MHPVKSILFVILFATVSACGNPFWLPPAHKIDIQQGNLITQEQIAQLQVGMSRDAVRSLLGEPVLTNGFEPNRWDYVYTRGVAGEHVKASNLIIFFDQDSVSKIDKNYHYEPGKGKRADALVDQS